MKKLLKIFLFFINLAAIVFCNEVYSQIVSSGAPYAISADNYINGISRQIQVDVHKATGKVICVWVDTAGTTTGKAIYCAIYNKDMSVYAPRFKVNKSTGTDQTHPRVRINQNDNTFAVIWASNVSGNYDVYVKKISLSATFSSVSGVNDLIVNNTTAGDQFTPVATFEYTRNEIIIAWRDNSATDGSGTGAYFRRLNYSGTSLASSNYIGTDIRINDYTTGNQLPVAIEVSPVTGELVTVCQQVMSTNTTIDKNEAVKKVFTYSSGTNSYSGQPEVIVNTVTTGDQIPTSLVINSLTGDYAISWSGGSTTGLGGYSKFYNKTHSVIKSDFIVNSQNQENQHSPKAVWDEKNNIVIYFVVYSTNKDSTITTIQFRIINGPSSYTSIANNTNILTPGPEDLQNFFTSAYSSQLNPILIDSKIYLAYDAFNNYSSNSKGRLRVLSYYNPNNASYAELKDELDGSYGAAISDTLFFKYEEKYFQGTSGSNLNYKIYDYNRNVLTTGAQTKYYGVNFFKIPLAGIATMSNGAENYYILEVTNDKGEVKMLRFRYGY